MAQAQHDIGMVGLGVMGSNLALNMTDKGFSVAGYDRDPAYTKKVMEGPAQGHDLTGYETPEAFCASLKTPRRIMIMVKAGDAVDWVIEQLLPWLAPGDILIDGGNTNFPDTVRRAQ